MGGGSSAPQVQKVENTNTNLPKYVEPYMMDMLNRGQAESNRQYVPYGYTTTNVTPDNPRGDVVRAIDPTTGQPVDASRIAGFTDAQKQAQNMATGMQQPGQYGAASDMAYQAGLGALNAGQNFGPGQFNVQQVQGPQLRNYQMRGPANVSAPQLQNYQMQGPKDVAATQLQDYQMQGPDKFDSAQAQQYMSPYMQNVVDVQKQQAVRDAKIGQLAGNLGAARQGTYGGARQLLAGTERERNLGQQMGQIQATGSQNAFQNAQQQFNTQQQLQQAAGQQNLAARLGIQQLGSGQNMQAQLANQQSGLTTAQQNLAAQLQTQGLGSAQALQAAMANQQMGYNVGNQNLQANLQTQQLGSGQNMQAQLANQQYGMDAQKAAEMSRQFGANLGMQGYQQANAAAQNLGTLGTAQQNSDMQRMQAMAAAGKEQQGLQQQRYDTRYADFLRQQNFPMEQLSYLSNMIHGLPVTMGSTATTYAPPPSMAGQLAQAGLGAAGLYKMSQGA